MATRRANGDWVGNPTASHFADRQRGVDLLAYPLDDGTALVFFVRVDGEPVPVEVRVLGERLTQADAMRCMNWLTAFEIPESVHRVTTNLVRRVPMSEVIAELAYFIEGTTRMTDAMPGMAFQILTSTGNLFGFRNTRDLKAAVERLHAATVYSNAVARGSRSPIKDVEQELDCSSERAKALVVGARNAKPPYLTRASQGVAAGRLTDHARSLIDALSGIIQSEGGVQK